MSSLRLWLIARLGGVDRARAEFFANKFLRPNGRAVLTVTQDGLHVHGQTFTTSPEQDACIAVAPWVRKFSATDCHFGPSELRA